MHRLLLLFGLAFAGAGALSVVADHPRGATTADPRPLDDDSGAGEFSSREEEIRGRAVASVVRLALAAASSAGELPGRLPAGGFEARKSAEDKLEMPKDQAEEWRANALRRAKVWAEPSVPVGEADLRNNPGGPGSFPTGAEVVCKFLPGKSSGRTPKFDCVFEGGDVLKVKYGRNPEIHTEVAATRLLSALGFGADTMYAVRRVRCFGCPEDPHAMLRCLSSPFEEVRRDCEPLYGKADPTGAFVVNVDTSKYVDFDGAAIERRKHGRTIEAEDGEGWGFDELDETAETPLGATRAERDALRLLAVFLNNWDNRRDNQRLICLRGRGIQNPNEWCQAPFAYMHDVGATFGRVGGEKEERKLDLEGWAAVPIWKDRSACLIRIEAPRLHGATFGEATISEGGRALVARLLTQLGERQVRDLFEGARFPDFYGASASDKDVGSWVEVFQAKVRQVADGSPCPAP